MDLDLDQMRSVVVLAEHLHFGRAAAALCVSQPALTKQIHKIEDILGGPLFVRRPRQLTLTRAGRVLIEHARVLLRDGQLAIDVSRSAMRDRFRPPFACNRPSGPNSTISYPLSPRSDFDG